MKIYRNTVEIRRKESLGRRLSLVGLAVLFLGLMASFVPTWLPPDSNPSSTVARYIQQYWPWISFAALPLGFIFASIGSYFINRFARRRWPNAKGISRPDEVLERSMKGFDDKYAYFVWSLPAHYVVAGPCGIVIFAVRSDRGRVIVQGDRWREPFSFGRIFTIFAREGVGNPSTELGEQERKLRDLLETDASSGGAAEQSDAENDSSALSSVPIEGAVVFLNSAMQLELDSPTVPTLRVDQVKDFLRRRARDVKIQTQTVRKLTTFLIENAKFQEEQS